MGMRQTKRRWTGRWAWFALSALLAGAVITQLTPFGKAEDKVDTTKPHAPATKAKANRLINEKSPYLLQHAHNPVDWHPWGEAAFAKAKKENKPVFLSIGYSTCHWCHVMEKESFEDDEVAALMNEHFVAIKVDREERPDIDKVYMAVTMAMTGSGGWPMTVILTPDKQPFFAGTYFPKEGAYGRPGMMQLLPGLARAWREDPARAREAASNVVAAVRTHGLPVAGDELGLDTLAQANAELADAYDPVHGGFGRAPKFPTPHNLMFLLRYAQRHGDKEALARVEKTLLRMRRGGVFDHVGLGFHRYSTDREWLLPHFEKMLYDQALMAIACVETYQATGKEELAAIAREIFSYVQRDMQAPEGGFYSAEDADSEGEEGKFYVWSPAQVAEIVGRDDAKLFNRVYDIARGGNFRDQATGRKTGHSIPRLKDPLADVAADLKMDAAALEARLEVIRRKLFEAREKRVHPLKDDKVLTDWNGLMIAALAKGAQALDEPAYAKAAAKAADFVLAKLRNDEGRLLKRYRQGEASLPAHLTDYAFMVWGLIDLYEATLEPRYLRHALGLNDMMLEHFWDDFKGGLFFTADDGEKLLMRRKEIYDGAIPSGNSVAVLNLLRLSNLCAKPEYDKKARAIIAAFSGTVARQPATSAMLMTAVDFAVGPAQEVVIAGRPGAADATQMLAALRRPFLPRKVLLFRPDGPRSAEIAKIAPYSKEMGSTGGQATAFVCTNFACLRPTTDVKAMLRSLQPPK